MLSLNTDGNCCAIVVPYRGFFVRRLCVAMINKADTCFVETVPPPEYIIVDED